MKSRGLLDVEIQKNSELMRACSEEAGDGIQRSRVRTRSTRGSRTRQKATDFGPEVHRSSTGGEHQEDYGAVSGQQDVHGVALDDNLRASGLTASV
jgi:hypothetical protein